MIEDTRRRSRRLRKKLHVGEFQEMGFGVEISLLDALTIEQANAFWDRFISDAIESQGLLYGGLESGYACQEHGSATETDRHHVQNWLESQPEVVAVEVHELSDAHSGGGSLFELLPVRNYSYALVRKHWAKFRRTAF